MAVEFRPNSFDPGDAALVRQVAEDVRARLRPGSNGAAKATARLHDALLRFADAIERDLADPDAPWSALNLDTEEITLIQAEADARIQEAHRHWPGADRDRLLRQGDVLRGAWRPRRE